MRVKVHIDAPAGHGTHSVGSLGRATVKGVKQYSLLVGVGQAIAPPHGVHSASPLKQTETAGQQKARGSLHHWLCLLSHCLSSDVLR